MDPRVGEFVVVVAIISMVAIYGLAVYPFQYPLWESTIYVLGLVVLIFLNTVMNRLSV